MIWKLSCKRTDCGNVRYGIQRGALTGVALAITCLFLIGPAKTATAQTSDIYRMSLAESDWYGNGVHQYYRGQYQAAIQSMTTSIGLNNRDPRPYYYRGLASYGCGNCGMAQADFQMGAQMEALRGQRPMREVNHALERIQGYMRMEIEGFRRDARVAATYPRGPSPTGPVQAGPGSIGLGTMGPVPTGPAPTGQMFSAPGPGGFDATTIDNSQPALIPGQFTPESRFPSGNTAPEFAAQPPNNPPSEMPAEEARTISESAPFGQREVPGAEPATSTPAQPEPAQPAPDQPAPVPGGNPFDGGAQPPPAGDNPFGATQPATPVAQPEDVDDEAFTQTGSTEAETADTTDSEFGADESSAPTPPQPDDSADSPFGEPASETVEDNPFGT